MIKTSVNSRVLMLIENSPYLLDRRVYPEVTTLTAAGYQVSVICPGLVTDRWREVVDGVYIYRFPIFLVGSSFLGYLFEYSYALVTTFIISWIVFFREGFDVIHAHNPPDIFVFIGIIYKLLGKRFIYDQHDLAPEMYATLFKKRDNYVYRLLVWLQRLSCRLADQVIVTNQSAKRFSLQSSGIPEERITVVRNGPDSNILKLVEADLRVGQPGKITLCYVGVMGHHDGVDYLLRALHQLVIDLGRTDFFCMLVGWGTALDSLKLLAEELGLADFVSFIGWIEPRQVSYYLSAADICIAPEPSNSYNDRCTVIKMAEYMALGKPVVAFDLPEHRITAQSAALYARPNDDLDLAQKIAWLMDNPQQRREMGRIGQERVNTELAWNLQAQHLLAVYKTLGLQPKMRSASVTVR